MAAMLSMQIKCPICLEDFKNPVSLPCDHTYFQLCIASHTQASPGTGLCPESVHINGAIVSAARENLEAHRPRRTVEGQEGDAMGTPSVLLCPEHKEGLKLFCMNDEKLLCYVCRDSDRHQRHHFRPATEAAAIFKEEVKASLDFAYTERNKLHNLKMKQTNEKEKTKGKLKQQHDHITAHCAMMAKLLQKMERAMREQVDRQERSALEGMQKNEAVIADRLTETDRLVNSLESGFYTAKPDVFLQWWSDKGLFQVQEMKCKEAKAEDNRYKSRTADLGTVPDGFTLGPYESFAPIFTWRNMLRCLTDALDVYVKVDPNLSLLFTHKTVQQADGEAGAVFAKPRKVDGGYKEGCVDSLKSGRCYWEVEVERETNWQLGLKVRHNPTPQPRPTPSSLWGVLLSPVATPRLRDIALVLKDNAVVVVRETGEEVRVDLPVRPYRIGVYLDCDRRQVTFCNANDTSVIYTVWCGP